MYKICKTEQSSNRQREIEQVLLKLMLEKRYDEISVSEICEKANVPRKSFYRYFEGKDGVMHSLIYHTITDLETVRLLNNCEENKLRDEFETLFNFWKNKKDLLEAFDKSGLIGLLVESTTNGAMERFGEIKRYLSDSEDSDQKNALLFAISGLMTITINWYRTGFAESVPNMARATTRIITRPLFENLSRKE